MNIDPGCCVPFSPEDAEKIREMFGSVPTTSALPVLPPTATRAQWLAARRNGIGASELPAIAGVPGAYGSPFAIWWSKRGDWETEATEEMMIGTEMEPIIAKAWLRLQSGAAIFRPGAALFRSRVKPWMLCTPDFLSVRGHVLDISSFSDYHEPSVIQGMPRIEPVECKAYDGGGGWGQPGTDQVPPHVEAQVIVQCVVLGAGRGHVARMRGKRVTTYVIEMTDERLVRMTRDFIPAGDRFMLSLQSDVPPAIDETPETCSTLTRLHPQINKGAEVWFTGPEVEFYLSAIEHAAKSRHELDLARNMIRQRLGDAENGMTPDGRRFVQRRQYFRPGYHVKGTVIDGVYPKGKQT